MATIEDQRSPGVDGVRSALLEVESLDVYYGHAHVLQSVSLSLDGGVLAVVGRNGMGKTTLCRAITGMTPASGAVRFQGRNLLGLAPNEITRLGVAYVPQGRRVWRSLSVDEHLRLASRTARSGAWTVERVYDAFPRLAERRRNGGAQLSGGEQQMLAIGRALLFNPRLLVMDEPTEGLAPVIVEHVATMLKALADEGSISILLIEQNLGVALEVAQRVAVMVNGRLAHTVAAHELAKDEALQQRLLGLHSSGQEHADAGLADNATEAVRGASGREFMPVWRVKRAEDGGHPAPLPAVAKTVPTDICPTEIAPEVSLAPVMEGDLPTVYLVGPQTKVPEELDFLQRSIRRAGLRSVMVDISPEPMIGKALVTARDLAAHALHPHGLTPTGQPADEAITDGLRRYLQTRHDLRGLIVLAPRGHGRQAVWAADGLPSTIPKFVIAEQGGEPIETSTAFVTRTMLGSLHRINEVTLATTVDSLAALMRQPAKPQREKPAICITALDITAPSVRHLKRLLGSGFDCLEITMNQSGQRTLAGLLDSGLVAGLIDLTPADVPRAAILKDAPLASERFDRLARTSIPYVGTIGSLDWLYFPPGSAFPEAMFEREAGRSAEDGTFVSLTLQEAERVGEWFADQVNRLAGPVRLLLPRSGYEEHRQLGLYRDAMPQQLALHRSLTRHFKSTPTRRLQTHESALNEMGFAEGLAEAFRDLIRTNANFFPAQRSSALDALTV